MRIKKPKKKPPYNQNKEIRGAIRRAFSRSPTAKRIKDAARREVPRYKKDGTLAKRPQVQHQCNVCKNWFPGNKVAVDHIKPVIDTDGTFVDWNSFVKSVFCSEDNLQLICNYLNKEKDKYGGDLSCHRKKTNAEIKARTESVKSK